MKAPRPLRASSDFVYQPARAVRVSVQEFQRRASGIGLGWGIKPMDDYLIPMLPGDLISILGRPGAGKTSSLLHLSRHITSCLQPNEVLVYATWETLVEEYIGAVTAPLSNYTMEDIGRGRADLARLTRAAMDLLNMGVIIVGQSMESEPGRAATLDDLDEILTDLRAQGITVRMVLVDYIQRIPCPSGRDRTEGVSQNLETCKDLALSHKVPFAVAAQARREVDDASGLQLPGLRDGQWTSNIEQTSDKVFAITKPGNYMAAGSVIKKGGFAYVVDNAMLCIKPLKQRWGPAGDVTWVLGFDPKTYTLSPMPIQGELAGAESDRF